MLHLSPSVEEEEEAEEAEEEEEEDDEDDEDDEEAENEEDEDDEDEEEEQEGEDSITHSFEAPSECSSEVSSTPDGMSVRKIVSSTPDGMSARKIVSSSKRVKGRSPCPATFTVTAGAYSNGDVAGVAAGDAH